MYIRVTPNGMLHIKDGDELRTKCGIDYRRYDYLPKSEEEYDSRYDGEICHKCAGTKREGPRTIKEALASKPYEERRNQ